MNKVIKQIIIILTLNLSGCAVLGSPHTHAACVTLDVGSTIAALETGFVEANPFVAAIIDSGGYPALIIVNLAIIYLFYKYQNKIGQDVTAVASTVRCAAGVHNLLLL